MRKKEIFTFRGINQDVTKSKHPKEFYYDGRNIRINTTDSQSAGSISNEKGNKIVLTIPNPVVNVNSSTITYDNKTLKFTGTNSEIVQTYTNTTSQDQVIIGHSECKDYIVLFSTDNNGYDCIWKLTNEFDLTLLYLRDLGFSDDNPIQTVFNHENEKVQKVYWVDGESQLRFINVNQSKVNGDKEDLIDLHSSAINIVGEFSFAQPQIQSISRGGTHTAGMIQYAYNLYRVNGAQTKLSPLSELIPLTKGNSGGGDVNELVGASPTISFPILDSNYSNIRIYAIKYTSYNQLPSISLIVDEEITNRGSLDNPFINYSYRDNGSKIYDISLDEFLFLGSSTVAPKHIESKDNTLFLANIKETNFDVDIDTRAFPHDSSGKSVLLTGTNGGTKEVGNDFVFPKKFDATNPRPFPSSYSAAGYISQYTHSNPQLYQKDGITLGGEGKYLKYSLVEHTSPNEHFKVFKSHEYYRIGIEFYNKLGQTSFPKWIGDFIAPQSNLDGTKYALRIEFKSDFYVWLNDSNNFKSEEEKPIGYKVLRADRTLNDRTVLCQGILNGMVSNFKLSKESSSSLADKWEEGFKLPSLLRTFDDIYPRLKKAEDYSYLSTTSLDSSQREFWKEDKNSVADTLQFNRLLQLYSPDLMFESVPLKGNLKVRVIGLIENSKTNYWNEVRSTETKETLRTEKGQNNLTDIKIGDYGIFGSPRKDDEGTEMDFYQFYREFNNINFVTNPVTYPLNNIPEYTEKGQGKTFYNNHPNLNYYNSLTPMLVDGAGDAPAITTVNSEGAPCFTLAIGPQIDSSLSITNFMPTSGEVQESLGLPVSSPSDSELMNLTSLESIYNKIQINKPNSVILVEIYTDDLGSVYGGRTYEAIKRTNYIGIGNYENINNSIVTVYNPGDTFVGPYSFTKLSKTDVETYSDSATQITEVVKFPVETTVDLKNRNDISKYWDKRFQPRYDEFHKYNRVYSQSPNLITRRDAEYTFKKVEEFDNKIIATKKKVPGEVIDSWTDLLVNEEMLLDGKYGPITGFTNYRDEIYAFQSKGFAHIAINPRVQTQGSDGVAVELGSGRLLHDYKYYSTNSGSSNKWGIITSEYGIYFVDLLNKSINRFTGKLEKLSDIRGLHSWTNTNLDYSLLSKDNPLKEGVNLGYDPINHSIFFTFLQGENTDTLVFNEALNSFTSFMDYAPSKYIKTNTGLLTLAPNNSDIYEQYTGDYNKFYGQHKLSYITLLVNPNSNAECVFDNIEFNSELYLNDIDQSDKTLTHIHAWNEYQDSGKIPLVIGRNSNLRRKFRTWRANIPRDGRNRMRNPWIYLKLEIDNKDNYKLILHDIIVSYTAT